MNQEPFPFADLNGVLRKKEQDKHLMIAASSQASLFKARNSSNVTVPSHSVLLNTYDETANLVDQQIQKFKLRKKTMEMSRNQANDIHITSKHNSEMASTVKLDGSPSINATSAIEIRFGDEIMTPIGGMPS